MAGTVKIKKSKNLRFRLISVLYLLFISLSILQIPIDAGGSITMNSFSTKFQYSDDE